MLISQLFYLIVTAGILLPGPQSKEEPKLVEVEYAQELVEEGR